MRNTGSEKFAKMKNKNIVITDNYLPILKFTPLSDVIFKDDKGIPWYFNSTVVSTAEPKRQMQAKSPGQFVHMIHLENIPQSALYSDYLIPIMKQLGMPLLYRIKMNLSCRLPEPYHSYFHVDVGNIGNDTMAQLTTSILYMNTCNGYTEFEDGTKVESVANRLVTFPANLKHHGTSCTDQKTRIVINFNYFK